MGYELLRGFGSNSFVSSSFATTAASTMDDGGDDDDNEDVDAIRVDTPPEAVEILEPPLTFLETWINHTTGGASDVTMISWDGSETTTQPLAPPVVIEMNLDMSSNLEEGESTRDDGVTIISSAPSVLEDASQMWQTNGIPQPQVMAYSPPVWTERALSLSTQESVFTMAADSSLTSTGSASLVIPVTPTVGSVLSLHPSLLRSSDMHQIILPPDDHDTSTRSSNAHTINTGNSPRTNVLSVFSTVASPTSSIGSRNTAMVLPRLTTRTVSSSSSSRVISRPSSSFTTSSGHSHSPHCRIGNDWLMVSSIIRDAQDPTTYIQVGRNQIIEIPSYQQNHTNPATSWYERLQTEEDWRLFTEQALTILQVIPHDYEGLSLDLVLAQLIQQEEEQFWQKTRTTTPGARMNNTFIIRWFQQGWHDSHRRAAVALLPSLGTEGTSVVLLTAAVTAALTTLTLPWISRR